MRQLQQFYQFLFWFFSAFDTFSVSFCFCFSLVFPVDLVGHVDVVHAHLGKVLKHNVIVVVLVVTLDIAMLLNGLHLLHGIRTLLLDGAWRGERAGDNQLNLTPQWVPLVPTWCRLQELEGHICLHLAAQRAAVQLDAHRVRDDNTAGIASGLALLHHGRRGQIDVLVLQVAIQSNACGVNRSGLAAAKGISVSLSPCRSLLLAASGIR